MALQFDEADGVAHGHEARRDTVGNLDVEPLLARHEDLDGVEAVGAQVLGQPGIVGDPRIVDAEVKGEDTPHGRRYVAHQTLLRETPTEGYASGVPLVPGVRSVFRECGECRRERDVSATRSCHSGAIAYANVRRLDRGPQGRAE